MLLENVLSVEEFKKRVIEKDINKICNTIENLFDFIRDEFDEFFSKPSLEIYEQECKYENDNDIIDNGSIALYQINLNVIRMNLKYLIESIIKLYDWIYEQVQRYNKDNTDCEYIKSYIDIMSTDENKYIVAFIFHILLHEFYHSIAFDNDDPNIEEIINFRAVPKFINKYKSKISEHIGFEITYNYAYTCTIESFINSDEFANTPDIKIASRFSWCLYHVLFKDFSKLMQEQNIDIKNLIYKEHKKLIIITPLCISYVLSEDTMNDINYNQFKKVLSKSNGLGDYKNFLYYYYITVDGDIVISLGSNDKYIRKLN